MNFLNLHVLFSTAAANPNRDDTGTPKQLAYGGVTRARISSQALTRPKRRGFEDASGGDQITYRAKSRLIERALAYAVEHAKATGKPLTDAERDQSRAALEPAIKDLVEKPGEAGDRPTSRRRPTRRAAAATGEGDAGNEEVDEETKGETLVWLAEPELRTAARQAYDKTRGTRTEELEFITPKRTQSLSIAAYGRMFAHRPDLQNEAAVQRSHAYTTHQADIDPDFFTAVNDLPELSAGAGAGHLDIAQLTGGVFYWHANIDRRQLWATWMPVGTDDDIHEQLTAFITALLTALPTGKEHTSAHRALPNAVLTVETVQPDGLHAAFESPVPASPTGGYLTGSITRLLHAQGQLNTFMPAWYGAQHFVTSGVGVSEPTDPPEPISPQPSLTAAIDAVVTWILAGRPDAA